MSYNQFMVRNYFKIYLFALVIGVFSGVMSFLFFKGVNWATETRKAFSWLIYFLPLAGILITVLYRTIGKEVAGGNNLILDEIHNPQKRIPFRMAPLIMLSSICSHLFGASVGREGTAVQMGASLADQFSVFLSQRRLLLMMGISAGFSSIFQTPISGTLFALEVLSIGQLQHESLLPCLISSIAGYLTAKQLGLIPFAASVDLVPVIDIASLLYSALAGIIFGLAARSFTMLIKSFKNLIEKKLNSQFLNPFFGGIFIILVFIVFGHDRYLGLGEDVIKESFHQIVPVWDFAAKIVTTTVSISSGYKGGEVMALFYIGATLGNTISMILPGSYAFYSALGFTSVFAGAANTPLTGIMLALELFGVKIGLFATVAVIFSYLFSGAQGIYHAQKKGQKHHQF